MCIDQRFWYSSIVNARYWYIHYCISMILDFRYCNVYNTGISSIAQCNNTGITRIVTGISRIVNIVNITILVLPVLWPAAAYYPNDPNIQFFNFLEEGTSYMYGPKHLVFQLFRKVGTWICMDLSI